MYNRSMINATRPVNYRFVEFFLKLAIDHARLYPVMMHIAQSMILNKDFKIDCAV
jgi:hypothetical protein